VLILNADLTSLEAYCIRQPVCMSAGCLGNLVNKQDIITRSWNLYKKFIAYNRETG